MATFIEQLEQETSDDAVKWLRSKPMEIYQDELYNPESIQQTPAPSSHARTSLASQGCLLSPQKTNLNNLIQTANSSHMSARAASPANNMGSEVEAVKRQAEDHTKAMTAPLASDSFPDNGKSMGSPQSTMKPRARLPLDHTCDGSMNDTFSFSLSLSFFTFLSFGSMATTRRPSSSNYSTESSAPTPQQRPSSTYSFVQNNMPNQYSFIAQFHRQSSTMRSGASDQAPESQLL
ncbi:hypothetical protein JMJ35_000324 [Cladonia borealis]|uniref:Uncharacterized protein n=1 Tax=Cladonia borealis TaxID=184061 RepID=A0AA39V7V3_9LECA|nr:hypothetical protein JMJ35_000324 [Cladonia borealis]